MFNDGFINIIREEIMKLIKTFISVLFSAFLLFSSTSSFAVEKLHFLIGGGAGGGWDGTARGTGEALTKAGFLKSASFENMSGGGGGKALAYLINNAPKDTVLVQSTPLVLRSITRHKGYVKGTGTLSYKDVKLHLSKISKMQLINIKKIQSQLKWLEDL